MVAAYRLSTFRPTAAAFFGVSWPTVSCPHDGGQGWDRRHDGGEGGVPPGQRNQMAAVIVTVRDPPKADHARGSLLSPAAGAAVFRVSDTVRFSAPAEVGAAAGDSGSV